MTLIPRPLHDETVRFRQILIDALWDDTGQRFGYVTKDIFVGTCPLCAEPIGCHFANRAPRAVLTCYGGCSEHEIGEFIRTTGVQR